MTKINVVDFFCGGGGFSCGFENAGLNISMGADNQEVCTETFKANHKNADTVFGDIRKMTKKDITDSVGNNTDVIIGGPPCQGFSMAKASKRSLDDPRNNLVFEYLRLVNEISPEIFVMENVRGFATMKEGDGLFVDNVLKKIRRMGYNTKPKILNSADYGVPQKRQRFFVIGYRDGIDIDFPEQTHSRDGTLNGNGTEIEKWVPVSKVLEPKNRSDKTLFYSKKLIKGFKRREKINKKRGIGFGWQFLKMNEPSYTISARYWKDGAEALVKYSEKSIRMLSARECARLQSFPEDYVFRGNKSEIYSQIGNAVPARVAEAIGREVKKALK